MTGEVRYRREGKRFVFETGLFCTFVSAVTILIGFCFPLWYESWPRVYSGFKRIGLWEACFDGLILDMDPKQKSYHGCWWLLAPEFYNIREWLMPAWFIFTQVAVTICFVANLVLFVTILIIWLRTGGLQRKLEEKPPREPFKLLHVLCGVTFGTAVLMSTASVVFGICATTDINWMPYQDFNYLSWSYGLAVVSAFFSIFACIALTTHVMIIRQEMREPPRDVTASTDLKMWAKTKDSSRYTTSSYGGASADAKAREALKGDEAIILE